MRAYRRGREEYLIGHYGRAAAYFKRALALDPQSPNLMYHVAKVNEHLGALDEAIFYYERYLNALSAQDAEEKARIRETLWRLRGARQARLARPEAVQEAIAPLPEATYRPRPRPEPDADPLFDMEPAPPAGDSVTWIAAGTGVGLLLAGTLTGLWAVRKETAVDQFTLGDDGDGSAAQRRDLIAQANRLATAADLMLASGGLALGVALVLLLVPTSETAESAPTAQLTDRGAQLHMQF